MRFSGQKSPSDPMHRWRSTAYQVINQLFEVNRVAATPITEAMVTAALKATAAKIKPNDRNPFRKGDAVVYPAHGVGRVERVGFEEIAGHPAEPDPYLVPGQSDDAARSGCPGARRGAAKACQPGDNWPRFWRH